MSYWICGIDELNRNSFPMFPFSLFGNENRLNGIDRDEIVVDTFNGLDVTFQELILGNVSAVNLVCPLTESEAIQVVFFIHSGTYTVHIHLENHLVVVDHVDFKN